MFLIKPLDGKKVPNPDGGKLLSEEGMKVESVSSYWYRRQFDKDVEITEVKAPAPEAKSEKNK